MESLHGNDSKHATYTETSVVGDDEEVLLKLGDESQLERSNSFSSSSDSFSDEEFFQLVTSELSKSPPEGNIAKLPPKLGDDAHLARVVDVQNGEISMGNGFSSTSGFTQSPPIQVMGKSDAADQYRIPSSVFARTKSTTPMEWSVASNESLFSIHPGNSSFSRDHVFLLGRSDELGNFPSPPSGYSSPKVDPDTTQLEMDEGLVNPAVTEAANAEAMKEVLRAAAEDLAKADPHPPPHSASVSRRSSTSGTSNRSFAFPILTKGRSGSINVESEQSQQKQAAQPANPEATSNAAPTSWFPCLSCRPFCC
ncbi:uncharacterized protein LOC143856798 [Tasmannia lanceolata]|uniref:uncharacterized protein LOC143856798 n=1 Tax=Tasmannia lanceolata TaxID=3420 RepID=UPI0040644FFB